MAKCLSLSGFQWSTCGKGVTGQTYPFGCGGGRVQNMTDSRQLITASTNRVVCKQSAEGRKAGRQPRHQWRKWQREGPFQTPRQYWIGPQTWLHPNIWRQIRTALEATTIRRGRSSWRMNTVLPREESLQEQFRQRWAECSKQTKKLPYHGYVVGSSGKFTPRNSSSVKGL